ncbi:hypothetical protein BJ170DRAFT_699758 [Xylariales sp. AK1849]|nr:hypothetical protein BJ170DRAFT_699758 [Xylariales sp. AK1849]
MHSTRESKFRQLLDYIEDAELDHNEASDVQLKQQTEVFINAPIFSSAVHKFVETLSPIALSSSELIPEYGLIGIQQDTADTGANPEDRLLLANINVPWSAFICGSQGAGKSHTLSCLLEASLLENNMAGELPHPLAGLVMHYDKFTSHSTTQLCEAAYLCSSGIPVTVMVSPSNVWAMKRLYASLPGLSRNSPRPKVVPLYLDENQLDTSRILRLMAVDCAAKNTPLYMEVVVGIIREMAMTGTAFTYTRFRQRLVDTLWVKGQETPLNMRLQMLDSFLKPSLATKTTKPAAAEENIWTFEPGTLTIVDLSDPFLSSENACTLFSICLSIFLEERGKCGRVVAMDEAHKFLVQSGEARVLADELTSIIRQQRHTGTRVLIATQEPTLSPELMDLANATFVHRFLSPAWYDVLKKHLAGANEQDFGHQKAIFEIIIALRTGEALLFCPTAQIEVSATSEGCKQLKALGSSYVKIKVRKRISVDGGKSIMATNALSKTVAAQAVVEGVRMYAVTTAQAKDSVTKCAPPSKLELVTGTAGKDQITATSKPKTGKQAVAKAQPQTKSNPGTSNDASQMFFSAAA